MEKTVTKIELAYMGGIFDGEGCISISKSHRDDRIAPSYTLMMRMGSASEYLARRFQFWFTGSIRVRHFRNPHYLIQYEWEVCAQKALNSLHILLPYLRVKRSQAEIAIRFQERMNQNAGNGRITEEEIALRESEFLEMKALKHNNN